MLIGRIEVDVDIDVARLFARLQLAAAGGAEAVLLVALDAAAVLRLPAVLLSLLHQNPSSLPLLAVSLPASLPVADLPAHAHALLDANIRLILFPDGTSALMAASDLPADRILCRPTELLPGSSTVLVDSPEQVVSVLQQNVKKLSVWLHSAGSSELSAEQVASFDSQNVHVVVPISFFSAADQVALYLSKVLKSDRADGLWTTMVVDERGVALGLVYSDIESLREAVRLRRGVYHSRKHGLWYKGETSGDTQDLLRIRLDCDRDCLVFVVVQRGTGFCHLGSRTCMGADGGLGSLERILQSRKQSAPVGSYTARLFNDPALLNAKLREEADELARAATPDEVALEAADLLYFALTACVRSGVTLAQVERILDQRTAKLTRRPGNAKPAFVEAPIPPPPTAVVNKSAPVEAASLATHYYADLTVDSRMKLCQRPSQQSGNSSAIAQRVTEIVNRVRQEGDSALLDLTSKFDGVSLPSPVVNVSDLASAATAQLSNEVKAAIDLAFSNVYNFHLAQVNSIPLEVETCTGVVCSRHVRPLTNVGLYVPGGSAVLPSTAIMLGVPALVAGCENIVLASPPRKDGTVCPEILYIASKIGAKKLLLAGGAQAIAALAYGTASVPKCDKICGPGNQFVTAAKMLVQNDTSAMVSIDMPAGPSELLVIADSSANPVFVSSDLLSQAEHGVDSQVVLVTVGLNDEQVGSIQRETERQVSLLPREKIARAALSKSFLVRCNTLEEALDFSNSYAPEHLIVNAQGSDSCMSHVQNAGSVFLGPYSAESCGDYASGTNHTLPTYGYARMYSGVSTSTFQKHITAQCVTAEGLRIIGPAVTTLASVEGLDAHRLAVVYRLDTLNGGA